MSRINTGGPGCGQLSMHNALIIFLALVLFTCLPIRLLNFLGILFRLAFIAGIGLMFWFALGWNAFTGWLGLIAALWLLIWAFRSVLP